MRTKTLLLALAILGLSMTGALGTAYGAYPDLAPPAVTERGEGDVALIVAIDEYAFLPNVAGARQNANDWERYFREARGVDEVLVITDQNATREDILDFAGRAVGATREDGLLWFVFIGHGAPGADGQDGVMVGMDARANVRSLQGRGVAQRELLEIFSQGLQRDTVMVIDACFSGVTEDGESLAPGTQPVIPLVMAPETERVLILSAARADEVAGELPGANRPAFSYLLLGALSGWSANEDGEVSAAGAIAFVERHLRAVPGRTQTPVLHGDRDFILARALEPSPADLTGLISRGGEPAPAREPEPAPAPEPTPAPEPAAEATPEIPAPKVEATRREVGMSSRGAVLTIVTGAALVATGGAFAGHSLHLARSTESRLDQRDPELGFQEAQRAEDLANRNAEIGLSLMGVGAVVGVVGVVFLQRSRTQVALGVDPGGESMLTFSRQW